MKVFEDHDQLHVSMKEFKSILVLVRKAGKENIAMKQSVLKTLIHVTDMVIKFKISGTCVEDKSVHRCNCNPGWAGGKCEIAICIGYTGCKINSKIYNYKGECSNTTGVHVCKCKKGWKEPDCAEITCTTYDSCNQNRFI